MAVPFSQMIARLSADERKLLDSTFSKYPELKDDWKEAKEDGLRQSDYSRKMNEIKEKETEFETAKTRAAELEGWAERNVPIWEGLAEKGIIDKETGEELWTAQKSALETQLEEARKAAVAGGDMDPAELDKRVREIVKANGGVSPEEFKALIASEGKKLAEETFKEQWQGKEKDFNERTIPFIAGFSSATAVVASRFEKETGEPWTAERQKEMFDLMTQEKNFDPFKVQDKMLAPFKAKKDEEARIQAEVEKRVSSMRKMPGGGEEDYLPGPNEGKGALREMMERSTGEQDFQSLMASKAREAGVQLKAEGKGK